MKRSRKRTILISLAVIIIIAAAAGIGGRILKARVRTETLAQCRDLVREGRYDEAGALAGKILKLDPKNNEARTIQLFISDLNTPPPWKLALENKLADRVTFDFVETPFRDVMRFLQGITGTNIILDEKVIRDLERLEVTLKVTDMKLSDAFSAILADREFAYTVEPEPI